MSIITIEEFNEEFSEQYPELAQLVCINEVELPINVEDN
jgi:hypothetical protein